MVWLVAGSWLPRLSTQGEVVGVIFRELWNMKAPGTWRRLGDLAPGYRCNVSERGPRRCSTQDSPKAQGRERQP